jgi:sugar lactone lactonase YvrE
MVLLGDKIWILDQGNNSLQEWKTSGSRVKSITTFNTSDSFNAPWGIAVGPGGNLYVTDASQRVLVFDKTGVYRTQVTVGAGDIRGVAFSGMTAYVTDYNGGGYIYTITGSCSSGMSVTFTAAGNFGQAGPGTLTHAYQDTVDASGNVWVADYSGAKVEEYGPTGTHLLTVTSASFVSPTSVKVLYDGSLLVTDEGAGQVLQVDQTGALLGSFGTGSLGYPEDAENFNGRYYVSDWLNSQIVVF